MTRRICVIILVIICFQTFLIAVKSNRPFRFPFSPKIGGNFVIVGANDANSKSLQKTYDAAFPPVGKNISSFPSLYPLSASSVSSFPALISGTSIFKATRVLGNGFSGMFSNWGKVRQIKHNLKLNQFNESTLSYTDYRLLRTHSSDFSGLIQKAFYLQFAFKFTLFTNIILPAFKLNSNVFAFSHLPSTFTTPDLNEKKEYLLYYRKLLGTCNLALTQYKEYIEKSVFKPANSLEMMNYRFTFQTISKALREFLHKKDLNAAMLTLLPFYSAPKKNSFLSLPILPKLPFLKSSNKTGVAVVNTSTLTKPPTSTNRMLSQMKKIVVNNISPPKSIPFLSSLSYGSVREICFALGLNPHSNFPILRSMNKHEISNYIAKLGTYDQFLINKDLNSLSELDVKLACTER